MTCSSSPTAVNLVIVEGDWLWYDVLSVFRLLFSPLKPVMKSSYPLLNDMIWCSIACEVLVMAVTSIMQFLRVSQLSACLESPSWWTDDDCYASEASKKPIFIQKKVLSFVIATVIVTLQVCCDEAIPLYDQKIHYSKYDVAKGLQELITLYGVTLHLLCLCFDSCLLCCCSHLLISIYIVAEWLLHFLTPM